MLNSAARPALVDTIAGHVQMLLIELGADPVGSAIDEHAATIKSEIAKWRKVAKEAGIQPQ